MELNTLFQGDDLQHAFSLEGQGLTAACALTATCWFVLNNMFLSDPAHSECVTYNCVHLEHYGRVIIIVGNILVLTLEMVKNGMKNTETEFKKEQSQYKPY